MAQNGPCSGMASPSPRGVSRAEVDGGAVAHLDRIAPAHRLGVARQRLHLVPPRAQPVDDIHTPHPSKSNLAKCAASSAAWMFMPEIRDVQDELRMRLRLIVAAHDPECDVALSLS